MRGHVEVVLPPAEAGILLYTGFHAKNMRGHVEVSVISAFWRITYIRFHAKNMRGHVEGYIIVF